MAGLRCGVLAFVLIAACFTDSAQGACATTFAKTLGGVPSLSIVSSALKALASSADSTIFPTAADGITLLAPTDAAFTAALAKSGLSAAEIGDKAVSILLYHAMLAGPFASKTLGALGSLQTALGAKLDEPLPLTFTTVGATTTAKGVKGSAKLGEPVLVCTSEVYIINSVLLPALTVAKVPSVLSTAAATSNTTTKVTTTPAAVAPATATVTPTAAVPAGAPSSSIYTIAPATAPVAAVAPLPAVVTAPVIAAPVTTAIAPITSTATLAPSLLAGLGLAPEGSNSGVGAFAVLSAASLLACSAALALIAL